MGQNVAILLHERYRLLQFLALLHDNRGQLSSCRRRGRDAIHHYAGPGSINEIESIIKLGRQLVNVFAIEWRDKCLVELGQDGMSEFIALPFDTANLIDLLSDIVIVRKKIDQGAGPGNEIVGHSRKHCEETVIPGNETDHFGSRYSESIRTQSVAVIRA